ncbi:immunity 26/phosphotriesterase HocA family protein [Allohahella marinimesophila]|uniref:Immunity protein 26 of polymorphic toxin system n=1 Tax=Allohahella marinimesophila TaxID=1054972 RepID=A0ABP7PTC8_9GAMM
MEKNKKRIVGDIVKIELEDKSYCFGRVLREPLMAFYDLKTPSIPDVEHILHRPILFKLAVMNSAVTSGRWKVIANSQLEEELTHPVSFFKQDPITKAVCLYVDDKEIAASKEECKNLERAAVWSAEHVEDRLRDHFLGVKNSWVESLKLKD